MKIRRTITRLFVAAAVFACLYLSGCGPAENSEMVEDAALRQDAAVRTGETEAGTGIAGSDPKTQSAGETGSPTAPDIPEGQSPADESLPDAPLSWPQMEPEGRMELYYANQFSVDYYPGGYALISITGENRQLLVPKDADVPPDLDEDITVIRQPLQSIYLAASSSMDFFDCLDALDRVCLTSTKESDWSLPSVTEAMADGRIAYAGKYGAPDYELVLAKNCDLVIESTMIYHSPQTKEQLETLGLPVLVERSSYEEHPLGRMEWVRLYGLLLGKSEEADAFFSEQTGLLDQILTEENTGHTAAFFYITSNGHAVVRKPGDYVVKMIEMAGGRYIFDDLPGSGDNALSTMNMQMEAFYAGAKDADYIFYNSTIVGELTTLEQFLDLSELLADFKAVKEGHVWCTGQNMFQQITGTAAMIADLHAVLSGEAEEDLTYLHRLK